MTNVRLPHNHDASIRNRGNKSRKFGMQTKNLAIVIGIPILGGLFCFVALLGILTYFYFTDQPTSQPIVLINTPHQGDTYYAEQTITVQSVARDESKVVRSEFWVSDELQYVEFSNLPGGISPMPMIFDWLPDTPGEYNLAVRAFNSLGEREMASIMVDVVEIIDRDKDGVPDTDDLCPDQGGRIRAAGCLDGDNDAIGNPSDACPEVAGISEGDGCPMPTEGDRDGDGLPDTADTCPDEPGSVLSDGCPDSDGDSLPDEADSCPAEPGLPEHDGCPTPGDTDSDGLADAEDECPTIPGAVEHGGCPDSDGDGVRDLDDACPTESGLPEFTGCPDTDGDGVPNHEDSCPFTPGPAENLGCPVPGDGGDGGEALDSDGDGVPDVLDLCPEDPGNAEHDGCPTPSEDAESSDDDIVDLILEGIIFPLFPGDIHPVGTIIEFQALSLSLNEPYHTLNCYVGLAGAGMERWGPYDLDGRTNWDLIEAADGSNSRLITVPPGEDLEVHVECGAEVIFGDGSGGGWGTYYDLGSFIERHPASEWHGDPIITTSVGGEGGRAFTASYRICPGSCESYDIQPAILTLNHGTGGHMLLWLWEGDRSTIDGFRIYVNGAQIAWVGNNRYSFILREGLYPPCGERWEYHVTAFRGLLESPPSNTAYWTGEPCPRQYRVIFDRLITGSSWGDPGDLEDYYGRGPIYGRFSVYSGFPIYSLGFSAADHESIFGHLSCDGYRLILNNEVDILDVIFRNSYSAPDRNYFTIEVDPEDDLSIGGHIMDCDRFGGDDRLFDGAIVLRASDITPGEYEINNRNITLVVRIEEIVGP